MLVVIFFVGGGGTVVGCGIGCGEGWGASTDGRLKRGYGGLNP